MGDVVKVWVWVLGSLLIALWLAPLAYNGGKALAELPPIKDFNTLLPGGLLVSWMLADRLFRKAADLLPSVEETMGYPKTGSMQNGVVPLSGGIAVGGLVYIITLGYALNRKARD